MGNQQELEKLRKSCQAIATKSSEVGGHTISNYFLPTGEPGKYKALVYGKEKSSDGVEVQRHPPPLPFKVESTYDLNCVNILHCSWLESGL